MTTEDKDDPHGRQAVLKFGPPLTEAAAVILLVHGRGASAQSMLGLYEQLDAANCAAIAPQAAGHTWYPQSFLAPLESNQPYLDSGLRRLAFLVDEVLGQGIASQRLILLGFSQGACLMSEFAARHPRTYGAILGLTGGLIGPPGTPRNYAGSLAGTHVFLGCGDPDPHVPFARAAETRDVFMRLGAKVDLRRYPGRPHVISEDELEACRQIIGSVKSQARTEQDPRVGGG